MSEPRLRSKLDDGTELFIINSDGTVGYLITRCGKIYSTKTNKFLSYKLVNGYNIVLLNSKAYTVHRLVALTFIPTDDIELYVDHINNIRTDNRVENLQWVTQKQNIAKVEIPTSHSKEVIQKDLSGNIIATYSSITEAAEAVGVTRHAVSKNCLKVNKTCAGFIFEYQDDDQHSRKFINISEGKAIDEYSNYLVFSDGKIYNNSTKKYLKPIENSSGYCYVTLCKNKEKKNMYIHVLVAKAFITNNDPEKNQVNHINRIKNDNRAENLEWTTRSENAIHAIITKNSKKLSREKEIELLIKYCEEFNCCPYANEIYEDYNIGNFLEKLKFEEIDSKRSPMYKSLSSIPIIKEDLDNYLDKKDSRLTFEQGVNLCFKFATENNKYPQLADEIDGFPIGKWYAQKKKEIRSKDDQKYIDLASNSLIKKNLDLLFKRRKNTSNEI